MNLHKILKIVGAVLGLIGAIFLAMIISRGDTSIESAYESGGDTSIVDNMAYVAYVIFALVVAFVVVFVVKNLFTNTGSLKSTLIGVGAFLAVLALAYMFSGGDKTAYFYNHVQATDGQSHMVGAGLVAFYILGALAILAMLYSGAKKMFN
jgi:uncharacterized protein YacL